MSEMRIDPRKASEVADQLNGRIEGDGNALIESISEINNATPDSLCFLANPKYEKYLYSTERLTVLVQEGFTAKSNTDNTLIYVNDVYSQFSKLMRELEMESRSPLEIDSTALIDESCVISDGVGIGALSIIKKKSAIGDNTHIMDQVYIGENVQIGFNVTIHPGVKVMKGTIIGNHVTIHANAVIGSDGFGFSYGSGRYNKVPQLGNVIIHDWVEIGAGSTIDRATMGATIISHGVKLDNLIQVGHNVVIGENTVIAAQTGIAGSTEIGEGSRIGGQVGISGHIKIAPYSQIQAKSGIASSVIEKGKKWYGYPIIPYTQYLRSFAIFKRLPEILARLKNLEKEQKLK